MAISRSPPLSCSSIVGLYQVQTSSQCHELALTIVIYRVLTLYEKCIDIGEEAALELANGGTACSAKSQDPRQPCGIPMTVNHHTRFPCKIPSARHDTCPVTWIFLLTGHFYDMSLSRPSGRVKGFPQHFRKDDVTCFATYSRRGTVDVTCNVPRDETD